MTLAELGTETANVRTSDLDEMSVADLLTVMNQEDRTVPAAVAAARPAIERSVHSIVAARRRVGRLIYLGAGTSDRDPDRRLADPLEDGDPGALGRAAGAPDGGQRPS